jgi:hypothetical protein
MVRAMKSPACGRSLLSFRQQPADQVLSSPLGNVFHFPFLESYRAFLGPIAQPIHKPRLIRLTVTTLT